MTCVLCKYGQTKPGKVTVTLQRGETTVIVKDVPAQVCENCGEYYLEEEITGKVISMAEEAVKKNAEVEIVRFAA
jgi:YgiT-type zinc finger domain-containing protein